MLNNFALVVPDKVHHGSLARDRNSAKRAPSSTRRSSLRRNPMVSFELRLSLTPVQTRETAPIRSPRAALARRRQQPRIGVPLPIGFLSSPWTADSPH